MLIFFVLLMICLGFIMYDYLEYGYIINKHCWILILLLVYYSIMMFSCHFSHVDIDKYNYQYKLLCTNTSSYEESLKLYKSINSINYDINEKKRLSNNIFIGYFIPKEYFELDTFDLSNYKLELNHK